MVQSDVFLPVVSKTTLTMGDVLQVSDMGCGRIPSLVTVCVAVSVLTSLVVVLLLFASMPIG